MPSRAVILFAHGAREPEWARPFEELRDRLRTDGLRVELAYLEIMKPDLREGAKALIADGAKAVTIVPLFLSQGTHLKRGLPEMVAALARANPDVDFRVTPALGDDPEILDAIAAWVKRSTR